MARFTLFRRSRRTQDANGNTSVKGKEPATEASESQPARFRVPSTLLLSDGDERLPLPFEKSDATTSPDPVNEVFQDELEEGESPDPLPLTLDGFKELGLPAAYKMPQGYMKEEY